MIKPRVLFASIAASAVLGGAIGSFATAATSSQASPASIASAIQKVRDSTAENTLSNIQTTLAQELTEIRRVAELICRNTVTGYTLPAVCDRP